MNIVAMKSTIAMLTAVMILLVSGCSPVQPRDYSDFRAHMPRSILVLPPLNQSLDAGASYSYLTVASEVIGEFGFYVYPVAVIDAFMKENGLPGPAEMQAVSLAKINEIIGADAVLYLTLEEFGQKFELLNSVTRITVSARLVDVKTGVELWDGRVDHSVNSTASNSGSFLGKVISAAVAQAGNTITDTTHDEARIAHTQLIADKDNGFLYGPRHPDHDVEHPAEVQMKKYQEHEAAQAAEAEAKAADEAAEAEASD